MKIPTGAVLREVKYQVDIHGFLGDSSEYGSYVKIDLDMKRLAEFSSKETPREETS